MKNVNPNYERHLVIRKASVPPGGEWAPDAPGWWVIQIVSGSGYCLRPEANQGLEPGTVVLMAGGGPSCIRGSQLSEMVMHSFQVVPSRLPGLISWAEQEFLESAVKHSESHLQILPPQHPAAVKMSELSFCPNPEATLFRINLLKLFYEIFGDKISRPKPNTNKGMADAKSRLVSFLEKTPQGELLEMNFEELARKTGCTPRHLGRIFREIFGQSFRSKRTEVRLARAPELLANSDFKVVDVALKCGYNSLSLFSVMFARQFGSSPGRWRAKNLKRNPADDNARSKTTRLGVSRKWPTVKPREARPGLLAGGLNSNTAADRQRNEEATAVRS